MTGTTRKRMAVVPREIRSSRRAQRKKKGYTRSEMKLYKYESQRLRIWGWGDIEIEIQSRKEIRKSILYSQILFGFDPPYLLLLWKVIVIKTLGLTWFAV